MVRVLLVFGLALVTAQAAGASLLLGAHQCLEHCDDDNDAGECAPGCHDCTCCAPVRVVPAREPVGLAPRTPGRRTAAPEFLVPPSADAREILHVPKRLAA